VQVLGALDIGRARHGSRLSTPPVPEWPARALPWSTVRSEIRAIRVTCPLPVAEQSKGSTGQGIATEVIDFYHLREGKIAEFWLLADVAFDYKAEP
jgi:hypothetical protein